MIRRLGGHALILCFSWVLFSCGPSGKSTVAGKLPVTIAGLYPYGSGLAVPKERLRKDDPLLAGFDHTLLKKVDDIVLAGIRDSAFSAAQVAIAKDGLLVYRKSFGSYSYEYGSREIDGNALFDLASLTKVIATTAAVMKLYDRHEIGLDDPVGKYLSPFAAGDKSVITIRHLLLHRGGFPPFRKFYEICTTPGEMLDSVYATALVAHPGDSTIYSDLGMITLGRLVEHVTGMSLASYVKRELYDPLGMQNTMFNPPHALWQRVVATEYDPIWRKALIRGTVHDENAALLGGVSGHAGLFSTAGDLAVFMQMVMGKGTYGGIRYFSENTVFEFTGKKQPGGERLLGWDLKSPKGSSAGDLFSESSFGHTGFTGTSIWVDPERGLFVVFLTNRVHPTRANVKLFKIRPVLHDAVIRALVRQPNRAGQ